jgi:transcriptional regulator with XRE-family HTH domain
MQGLKSWIMRFFMERVLFAERIRDLRGQRGQQEVADLVGVPKNRWSTWELGKHEPKLQDLFSVCKTFGVSSDWVLGLSDDRGGQQQQEFKPQIASLKKLAVKISEKADDFLASINKLEATL